MGRFSDPVMQLPGLIHGIDLNCNAPEIAHLMEELMTNLLRDGMPLSHRQRWCHRNAHFCPELMSHPTGLHVRHHVHARDMLRCMPEVMHNWWVHTI